MQKTKKVRCIFTKIYGIDLLLNFEGKHVSSAIILNTIQDVISLNCLFSCIYFFTKLFFCVSENQERNVGLLKQVFPC